LGKITIRALLPPLASVIAPAALAADLTDLSLESLLEARVTSVSKYEQTLAEVPAAVSVITRDEIRAYGWRTLNQALSSLPGIYTSYDRQYDYIGTRGFNVPGDFNTRVLLAINGNRTNDIVYDSAALGRNFPLDLDLIERIEFIPGPGGAVYGQNAMFGVINVITRNGLQVDGWEFASSWQQPQQTREGRLRWGRRLDNGTDVLLSLAAMKSDGEDLFLRFPGAGGAGRDVSGIARGLDGEEDRELSAHIGRGSWNLDVRYGSRTKDDPTGAYFSDPLVRGQYERDDYVLTQLQYQGNLGASWDVRARAFAGHEKYSGMFRFDGEGNYSTGVSEWSGAELRLLNTRFAGHKLMFGAELQDNGRIDQTAADDATLSVPGRLPSAFPAPAAAGGAALLIERDGYRAGVYAQDEWQLADTVSTSLGLRVDRNDTTGTRLSPRAALIWQAAPELTLKTIYGRAHRAPNSYERDYDDGIALVANPRLSREDISTLEFVADAQVSRAVGLRASVYQWRMDNLIQLGIEPLSGVPQYRSGGDVEASGAELSANMAWNSGGRLRASLSWQDVSYTSGALPANSPEYLGRLNYARPLTATLDLGLELQYDGERRAIDGTTLDGYWLANVNLVAGGLISGLELSLTLLNLFDEHYEHPAADSNWQNTLEQDGRAVRLRLDYRF
jgi:outer membrane receptor protein involved in Fe transport